MPIWKPSQDLKQFTVGSITDSNSHLKKTQFYFFFFFNERILLLTQYNKFKALATATLILECWWRTMHFRWENLSNTQWWGNGKRLQEAAVIERELTRALITNFAYFTFLSRTSLTCVFSKITCIYFCALGNSFH